MSFCLTIRGVDAIICVIRCFEDENVTRVVGDVDPIRDMKIMNLELLFADIEMVENVLKRVERKAKNSGDK